MRSHPGLSAVSHRDSRHRRGPRPVGCPSLAYARSIIGVILCIAAAAGVGAGVQSLLDAVPRLVRFGITTTVIVTTAGLLLAYTQGLSPRTVIQSLRGKSD